MAESKMMNGIKVALDLINAGEYVVDAEAGTLTNTKTGKVIGSLDKPSGNIFYVIKGVDILAHRLLYAYYHSYTALTDESKIVKHLDGCKQNNGKANLVMVNRKGWKQELESLRTANGITVEAPVKAPKAPKAPATQTPQATTQAPVVLLPAPQATPQEWNEKDLEARKIWMELHAGATIKEVAEKLGVKESRVYDVKRRKSNAKATADLPELA